MFAVVVLGGGGYCREVLACVNESMCCCVTKIETDRLCCSFGFASSYSCKTVGLN